MGISLGASAEDLECAPVDPVQVLHAITVVLFMVARVIDGVSEREGRLRQVIAIVVLSCIVISGMIKWDCERSEMLTYINVETMASLFMPSTRSDNYNCAPSHITHRTFYVPLSPRVIWILGR